MGRTFHLITLYSIVSLGNPYRIFNLCNSLTLVVNKFWYMKISFLSTFQHRFGRFQVKIFSSFSSTTYPILYQFLSKRLSVVALLFTQSKAFLSQTWIIVIISLLYSFLKLLDRIDIFTRTFIPSEPRLRLIKLRFSHPFQTLSEDWIADFVYDASQCNSSMVSILRFISFLING